ncbi:MAG: carboxypeptidase M32, partial [Pseudomonadota bacterium]
GHEVPDPTQGVLQDVHWSVGLFGYFPTYSIGNIYAACLDRAMRRSLPDCDEMIRSAQVGPILEWMRVNVHSHGRTLTADDLIARATGEAVSTGPLLTYLENKYQALYQL